MPRKKPRKRKTTRRKQKPLFLRKWLWRLLALSAVFACLYVAYLDYTVRSQFEGKRWSVPARVYARPLELYSGLQISPNEVVREIKKIGFQKNSRLNTPASFWRTGNDIHLVTREFEFWDGVESAKKISIRFNGDEISSLRQRGSGADIDLVRIEPLLIGGIYPAHKEDRLLVQLKDTPELLVKTLFAVEDRDFYSHYGVVPKAILRAMWTNLRAGKTVQGGSTITQQLVKNFFLSSQRSLVRKANEAIMALLLEWHYEKEEILEAYINEVYLGQSGQRAIHGFGLASNFYFGRRLSELDLAQMALLAGTIKGPSYYNPRRHPKRAIKRRNLVLKLMHEQGLINKRRYQQAKKKPLQLIPKPRSSATEYPAYLDLVRRQLRRDYRDDDLRSEGLQIFTSFDPHIQWQAELSLKTTIESLEKQRKLPAKKLQGAVVVTSSDQGEILALVGGRDVRQDGFNRALDAIRPIGSLIKPAVYLAALDSQEFTLASLLDDTALTIDMGGKEIWRPANYDRKYHGQVLLRDALIHSYNVSTVRLGQQLGMNSIADTLRQLGVRRSVHRFPSLPLGTAPFSPIEVTQMYQTLSASGFRSPLRSIRAVLDAKGNALQRYPLTVQQVFSPASVHLINSTLQSVVEEGTARGLKNILPEEMIVAGKTGTTDDLRDSWFAGFTGSHVAVVWLGMDDNRAARLTGASGAMRVWGSMIRGIRTQPLTLAAPEGIEEQWIERKSGLRGSDDCDDALVLPFITGSAPRQYAKCAGGAFADTVDGFLNIFGTDE